MRKGLLDYMTENPYSGGADSPAPVRDLRRDTEEAREMMKEISAQMEQGFPPQAILYNAFSLIGFLLHDETWTDPLKGRLRELFGSLDPGQLFSADEAEKLDEAQREYREKVIRQLTRNISSGKKLTERLEKLLAEIEPPGDDDTPEENPGETSSLDIPL